MSIEFIVYAIGVCFWALLAWHYRSKCEELKREYSILDEQFLDSLREKDGLKEEVELLKKDNTEMAARLDKNNHSNMGSGWVR